MMKTLHKMMATGSALLLMASTAFPVDLKNEDGQRYEVKIHTGSSTLNTWVDSNTLQTSVCSDCVIEVVGVGTVKAKGSVTVVIKDGKLALQ